MNRPAGLDGAARGDEGLRRDLAAEDALAVLVGAQAPKEVDLERFELQEVEQVVERRAHRRSSTPVIGRSGLDRVPSLARHVAAPAGRRTRGGLLAEEH